MKQYTMLLVVLSLLSFSIFAQETEKDGKKSNKIDGAEKVAETTAVTDEIKFKNGTGNAIITITDEGSNIGSSGYRDRIAQGIVEGILVYQKTLGRLSGEGS